MNVRTKYIGILLGIFPTGVILLAIGMATFLGPLAIVGLVWPFVISAKLASLRCPKCGVGIDGRAGRLFMAVSYVAVFRGYCANCGLDLKGDAGSEHPRLHNGSSHE